MTTTIYRIPSFVKEELIKQLAEKGLTLDDVYLHSGPTDDDVTQEQAIDFFCQGWEMCVTVKGEKWGKLFLYKGRH